MSFIGGKDRFSDCFRYMELFYYGIVAITCLSMLSFGLLIHENARFDKDTKNTFYILILVTVLACLSEFGANILNGAPGWTRVLHLSVKVIDYCISPYISYCMVRLLDQIPKIRKGLFYFLGGNVVLQIVGAFFGWFIVIDENNYLAQGPAKFVYAVIYLCAMCTAVLGFIVYAHQYSKRNIASLLSIGILVGIGTLLQEAVDNSIKTCVISLCMGVILIYIHYGEFALQKIDADLKEKNVLIERDSLTGLLNRYSFIEAVNRLESGEVSRDLVVISIDVNGLKKTNDMLGHSSGDEMIRGAATCLHDVLSGYGNCYRTGGDEFIALINVKYEQIKGIKDAIAARAKEWTSSTVPFLSFSCGFASKMNHEDLSVSELVKLADAKMYAEKAKYYRQKGLDRREQPIPYETLCETYEKILIVDLIADTFEIVRVTEDEADAVDRYKNSISCWLRQFADSDRIHPDDKERFAEFVNVNNIRKRFLAGSMSCSIEYKRKTHDEYRDALMEIVSPAQFTETEQTLFIYVKVHFN